MSRTSFAQIARNAGLLALLLWGAACGDQAPVSGPGPLTATLSSPHGAEGAAVIVLLGDAVGEVSPAGGATVYSLAGDSQVRVVLMDTSPSGGELSFVVEVADTTQPPAYVIEEVAGPDDALRDASAYTLEFRR